MTALPSQLFTVSRQSEDTDAEPDDRELEEALGQDDQDARSIRIKRWRLIAAFFLFGVFNNSPYVVILSAAVDLVPAETPKVSEM